MDLRKVAHRKDCRVYDGDDPALEQERILQKEHQPLYPIKQVGIHTYTYTVHIRTYIRTYVHIRTIHIRTYYII